MGKLWVVLVLLLSTLSSNPLGSMEQSTWSPAEPLAHVTALPLLRLADAAAEQRCEADRLPRPEPLRLAATPVLPAAVAGTPERAVRVPRRDPSAPVSSFLEHLPHFATPPPALALL